MKKSLTLITLTCGISIMTAPAFAEFASEEAAARVLAKRNQKLEEVKETIKRGVTDDVALKEAIQSIVKMPLTIPTPVSYTKELSRNVGIPDERVTTAIEEMIYEKLSDLKKNEEDSNNISWDIISLLPLLDAFPEYEIMPLLKECLQVTDEKVRDEATKRHNIIMGKTQEPPNPQNGVTPEDKKNDAKQSEPPIEEQNEGSNSQ